MIFGSVCSGIEAASVAWHPLGWRTAFMSDIEKFPRAVLAHHYPEVPLHGDFTTIQEGDYDPIELLVGGTPCQDFSVAGLRAGITGERGNLTLEFIRLAARLRPRWIVWENVPGILSDDGGRSFGAFLGGLGIIGYGFAYRVLDAQFSGLAQRRERVFVVGYLGDWRRAAAVLFEREGLRWNPPPSRQAGERIAPTIASRPTGGGGLGTDFDCDGDLITGTLVANGKAPGSATSQDAESGMLLARCVTTREGRRHDPSLETYVTHSLRADGFDASEDGTGRGTPIVPIAFSSKDHGADASELAPTLRAMGHAGSHANAGGQVAVAFPLDLRNAGRNPEKHYKVNRQGVGTGENGDPSPTISAAFTPGVATLSAVRRLTPRECERLQGFPDDYSLISYRGKRAADGPRYKALGNSMAVPVMRWIGERIQMVEELAK